MTKSYNLTLGLTDGTHMNLTSEGFKSLSYDALTFDTEGAAQSAFAAIDASSLIQDGFKGFHEVKIWLTQNEVAADDEISSNIIAEKAVTVDTLAA